MVFSSCSVVTVPLYPVTTTEAVNCLFLLAPELHSCLQSIALKICLSLPSSVKQCFPQQCAHTALAMAAELPHHPHPVTNQITTLTCGGLLLSLPDPLQGFFLTGSSWTP